MRRAGAGIGQYREGLYHADVHSQQKNHEWTSFLHLVNQYFSNAIALGGGAVDHTRAEKACTRISTKVMNTARQEALGVLVMDGCTIPMSGPAIWGSAWHDTPPIGTPGAKHNAGNSTPALSLAAACCRKSGFQSYFLPVVRRLNVSARMRNDLPPVPPNKNDLPPKFWGQISLMLTMTYGSYPQLPPVPPTFLSDSRMKYAQITAKSARLHGVR